MTYNCVNCAMPSVITSKPGIHDHGRTSFRTLRACTLASRVMKGLLIAGGRKAHRVRPVSKPSIIDTGGFCRITPTRPATPIKGNRSHPAHLSGFLGHE